MKKKRVLGFLLAVSKPMSVEVLGKVLQMGEMNPEMQIQELIEEGKLKGSCKNSYYIPDKFSRNQKEMIQKFY
jgi:DNA-binding transcriptional regulator GbsR (MarR family)